MRIVFQVIANQSWDSHSMILNLNNFTNQQYIFQNENHNFEHKLSLKKPFYEVYLALPWEVFFENFNFTYENLKIIR